jgi:hypothetical protein
MSLLVANASIEAAEYSVKNWHYSRCLPTGKLVKYGVWENKKFIGVVIYSRGASPHLGTALELDQTEVCELTRVALDKHEAPVSQILAITLSQLKLDNPGLRAVVSFADPKEGHVGGIYKAGNWLFTGTSNSVIEYFINGRWVHTRGAYHHPKRNATTPKRESPGKFRYIYPLDRPMRRKVSMLALPYPNAVEGLKVSRSNSVTEKQVRSLPTAREKN